MSGLTTSPATVEVGSGETLPVEVNFAAWLGSATISTATATLTHTGTGTNYAAGLSTRTNSGTTVTQTLTALGAGRSYRLVVAVTDSTSRVWTSETTVKCPF